MSFGVGPYGLGPYGLPVAILPGELRAPIHSSRYIDKFGRYMLLSDTGEFLPMDDVHQRIVLLLAYNFTMPSNVGIGYQYDIEGRIRTALRPMTAEPEPAINIKSVDSKWEAGNMYINMRFLNFLSGQSENIEVSPP